MLNDVQKHGKHALGKQGVLTPEEVLGFRGYSGTPLPLRVLTGAHGYSRGTLGGPHAWHRPDVRGDRLAAQRRAARQGRQVRGGRAHAQAHAHARPRANTRAHPHSRNLSLDTSRRNLKPTKPAIQISDADRERKILITDKCTMAFKKWRELEKGESFRVDRYRCIEGRCLHQIMSAKTKVTKTKTTLKQETYNLISE